MISCCWAVFACRTSSGIGIGSGVNIYAIEHVYDSWGDPERPVAAKLRFDFSLGEKVRGGETIFLRSQRGINIAAHTLARVNRAIFPMIFRCAVSYQVKLNDIPRCSRRHARQQCRLKLTLRYVHANGLQIG